MFLLVSGRHVGAHLGGHQHGGSIQISINLGKTFLRISSVRKIAVTWILARVFAYLPSFHFQILDLIYWTLLIFLFWSILNGMTLKTSNYSMVVYHTGGSRGLSTVCANGKQKSLVVSSIRIGHFTIYLPIPNFLRETRMSSNWS